MSNDERLRWITNPPTLDTYSFHVRLADTPTGTIATLYAEGRCDRKRRNLWTYSETIEAFGGRYGVHDLLTHISMVAVQDRPTTEQALTRGLVGSAWDQPELPF
jgi:hypothetical protein